MFCLQLDDPREFWSVLRNFQFQSKDSSTTICVFPEEGSHRDGVELDHNNSDFSQSY